MLPNVELVEVWNYALKGLNFKAEHGCFTFLLGPSGAGKTTALNVMAGLVDYEGSVLFDGSPVDKIPPDKRCVGLVPQNLALFSHMTVEDNIAYGLKLRKLPKSVVKEKVLELAKLLDLKHLLHRYPGALSGGERQRVAIARALAINPRVLLLDEPFNNLDAASREVLKLWLVSLQKALKLTTILVTHEVSELKGLKGKAVVLVNGKAVEEGPLENIASSSLGQNLIGLNLFKCEVYEALGNGLMKASCGGLNVVHEGGQANFLYIPPTEVKVSKDPFKGLNAYRGVIVGVESLGSAIKLKVAVGDHILSSIQANPSEAPSLGEEVYVRLPMKSVRALR
ncbi:MAG: hypothetical protein DRJ98_02730 [Thermoprotei archaeon]|nr:MAG: hypothetical protein DRJ98_02730 [Thermoprotei archaeon]